MEKDLSKGNKKQALIRSGLELMTSNGYMSSNLENILKAVGVPKGSFYYYFKSKEDFGSEILESYNGYFTEKIDKHLLNRNIDSPLERILAFSADAIDGMQKYDFKRGCLIGEFMQETALLPDTYNTRIKDILSNWEKRIAACLSEAQEKKEIKPQLNCEELSSFFWIGWEGAVSRAKLEKNKWPLDKFMQNFLLFIKK